MFGEGTLEDEKTFNSEGKFAKRKKERKKRTTLKHNWKTCRWHSNSFCKNDSIVFGNFTMGWSCLCSSQELDHSILNSLPSTTKIVSLKNKTKLRDKSKKNIYIYIHNNK